MKPSVLGIVLMCAAPMFSQDRLVTMNVVVLDNHGQPLADLTADDFQLDDQGKHHRIAVFHPNDMKSSPAAHAALAPHEFSNRSAEAPPAATLILLDLLNLAANEQGYARTQLVKVLQSLESADYVYLYLLTQNGILPVRGLPDADLPVQTGPPWTQRASALLEDAYSHVNRLAPDMYTETRTTITYMALEALASRLAALPGRKSIVWISHGVPISIGRTQSANGALIDFEPMLHQLTSTLEAATIAMYPVGDLSSTGPQAAKGLGAFNRDGTASPVARGTGPQPQQPLELTGGSVDTISQIAARTGGRVHLDNDIGTAVKQATDDARLNYTIGFAPDEWDGKYHKLRVVCTRKGSKVLAKDGYFAYPIQPSTADQEKAALDAAAWSPFDAGEIGVRAVISPSSKVPQAVHLQVRIEAGDLRIQRQDDRFAGSVSVTYVTYDADGKQNPSAPIAYPFKMTAEQHQGALKDGIRLSPDRPMTDAIRKVRVIVFDRNSSAVGSLTIPVTPADLSPHP
jgi:VWFA-related protein